MAQADENSQCSSPWMTRLPPDVDDDVTEYREERDISKSEALRRLVQQGLHEKSAEEEIADDLRQLRNHLAAIGVGVFVPVLYWPTGGLLAGLTVMMSFVASATGTHLLAEYIHNR